MTSSALSDSQSVPASWFRVYDYLVKILLASLLVSIAVAQVVAGLLAAFTIVLHVQKAQLRRTPFDIPVLLFIVVRILAVLCSQDISVSAITLTREVPFYFLYFCFALYLQNATEKQLFSTLQWLFVSTALVAIIAGTRTALGQIDRANGFSGGGTLAMHVTLSMTALVALSTWKIFNRRAYTFVLMAALLFGLAFSMTRGEWLATVSVLIIYYSVFNKKMMAILAGMAVVLVLVIAPIRMRLMTLIHPLENTSDRLTLWESASRHIADHPFLGYGPETFHQVFDRQENMGDHWVASWHNDVIQTYMETGMVGLAAWLLLFGTLGFQSIKLLRISPRSNSPDEPLNVIGARGWMGVLLLVSYLIGAMFSIPTYQITNGMLFRFLLALVGVAQLRWSAAVTTKECN